MQHLVAMELQFTQLLVRFGRHFKVMTLVSVKEQGVSMTHAQDHLQTDTQHMELSIIMIGYGMS